MLKERSGGMPGYRSQWRTRNAHWLSMVMVFLVVAAFSRAVYELPLAAYVQDLNVDDSFYYYTIARNFSHGLFSTADGIHLTNGYHPIWAWLLIPVFALVKDPVTALRVAKVEELALLLVATCFAMSAGRTAAWSVWTTAIIPAWFFGKTIFFRGLEVSAQVATLAALMFLLPCLFMMPKRRTVWVAVALICAILPWVRLECLAVSIATPAIIWLYMLLRREPVSRRSLLLWGAATGGSILYLIYNKILFGTSVPVSGQIKGYWSAMRFAQNGGYDFFANTFTFLKQDKVLAEASLMCLAIVVLSWLIPTYRRGTYASNHGIDAFVLVLAAAHAARIAYSICFLYISYDVEWYYVPGLLLLVLVVPLAISRGFLLAGILTEIPMLRKHHLESYVGVLALLVSALVVGSATEMHKWHSGWRPDWGSASFEGTQWMNANLPAGTIIGSSDSGVIGYFSQRPVVNLDGLVNSNDFLIAVKSQSVETWIKKQHINYLANAMWTDESGCRFMASASGQLAPYSAPCALLYEGNIVWNDTWSGKLSPMRFRVLGYNGSSLP
jgi:hypothetical protein